MLMCVALLSAHRFDPPTAYGNINGIDDPSMGWSRYAQVPRSSLANLHSADTVPLMATSSGQHARPLVLHHTAPESRLHACLCGLREILFETPSKYPRNPLETRSTPPPPKPLHAYVRRARRTSTSTAACSTSRRMSAQLTS